MENKGKTLLLKNGKDIYGEKIDILTVMETSTFTAFAKKILEESAGKIEPREKEGISFIVVDNEIKMIKK